MIFSPIRTHKELSTEKLEFPGHPPVLQSFPLLKLPLEYRYIGWRSPRGSGSDVTRQLLTSQSSEMPPAGKDCSTL